MYQIDDPTAVASEPALPTIVTPNPGWFTGAIPGLGVRATKVRAWWLNMIQGEIMNVVLGAGLTLTRGVNDQLFRAILALRVGSGRSQVWATPGTYTWTVPAGVYWIRVGVIGGGGGGGLCQTNSGSVTGSVSGSGGGAGGHAAGIYAVTPGQVITIVVGAGGSTQVTGGTSSFGTLCSAVGGAAGLFNTSGLANSAGGAGGPAYGGTLLNMTGGFGSDGQSGGLIFAGNGAPGPFGGGGRAGAGGGFGATGPGAGGGGAYDSTGTGNVFNGGAGGGGRVTVEF